MSAAAGHASPSLPEDSTARARIRDAAIVRFAAHGVAATSIKAIAADVGVSPPLVIHHFGSKEGLRVACDAYVAAVIRDRKRAALAAGPGMDPLEALRQADQGPPLMRYLAQTLTEGSHHVAGLIDEMVDDAVAYMAEAVDNGLLKASDHPRQRAVVLVVWQLGALVLHEHVERLLGADLTGDAEGLLAWAVPAAEILSRGVFDEGLYERLRAAAHEPPTQQD